MLDLTFIRQHPEKIQQELADRGLKLDFAAWQKLDAEKLALTQKVEALRAKRNAAAAKKDVKAGKTLKIDLRKLETELTSLHKKWRVVFEQLPNLHSATTPTGKSAADNKVIKEAGEKPRFNFSPKSHVALGEQLGIVDVKRAANVSGSRFSYLAGDGALLEWALTQFAVKELMSKGFVPLIPPMLINKKAAEATGAEELLNEDAYHTKEDELVLVGTSEHAIVTRHMEETLPEAVRYVGFSTCFRREAGSYGKDTAGIIRQHQFDKVEMVSFARPEDSEKELRALVTLEEALMTKLGLPYRLVQMCTADLAPAQSEKIDLEVWLPSEERYLETHSAANCTDYQARRTNTKIATKDGPVYAYTLNATALAIGRTITVILEHYQQADGSVAIPEALQPYWLGKKPLIT